MSIVSVVIFLCLVFNSYEKSTPQDDHYVGAVVEYQVTGNVATNLVNYANLIKEAADQGADIVVFPELTLTNGSTYFTVPINGALKQYPIPALSPLMFDEFMVGISTAARQNDIYVVINGRERVDCTNPDTATTGGETCPEAKEYIFNTNVVFDRSGAVIDRFRKINLFGEASHTPALRPELGLFTTDFGVTFGHFICFDLMFQVPAVQVVQKSHVKDVIFPTMWFSELPYLTAVQIQEAYAYSLDVNFLGAGANNVRVGSAGSGIYSGKAGALISIMPGIPTTKVLVAKVPKVPGQVTEPYPGPIYDNPADHDNLRLITDLSLPSHISRLLQPGSQVFTLEHRDTTCTFNVTLAQRESTTAVQYRAFIEDGTHTYARREVGIAACLLVACKSDDVTTCSYRFNQTEQTTIEKLEIEMQTYRNTYNDTLDCDNIEYFPVTVRYNKFPLSPKNFTYTTKLKDQSKCEPNEQNTFSVLQKEIMSRNNRERINFKINVPQNELVAFGIWERIYNRDVDHNKEASEEDIQNFNTLLDEIFSSDYYRYRAGVFSGVRSFSGVATGGTRICGIYACTGDTRETCGLRFSSYIPDTTAIFEELTITARMPTPAFVNDLETNNAIVYPVSSKVSIMPLESKEFDYTTTRYGTNTIFTMSLKNSSAELLTFAVWGRRFATDGQVEDPALTDAEGDVTPVSTTEGPSTESTTTVTSTTETPTTQASTTAEPDASAVHLLSRVLFACMLALLCYTQF